MCSFTIIRAPGFRLFDGFDADVERHYPIEDEHHAIFDCVPWLCVGQDLFADDIADIATVDQLFAQRGCDCIAKFLADIKLLRSCLV